jgi:hypothetical protein
LEFFSPRATGAALRQSGESLGGGNKFDRTGKRVAKLRTDNRLAAADRTKHLGALDQSKGFDQARAILIQRIAGQVIVAALGIHRDAEGTAPAPSVRIVS